MVTLASRHRPGAALGLLATSALLGWGGLGVGCAADATTPMGPGESLTQIILEVDTDLPILVVSRVEVVVSGPGGSVSAAAVRAQARFPATLGIQPPENMEDAPITVTVSGANGFGVPAGERIVETHFLPGESRKLAVFLSSICAATICDIGTTCTERGCVDPYVDPESLPEWTE